MTLKLKMTIQWNKWTQGDYDNVLGYLYEDLSDHTKAYNSAIIKEEKLFAELSKYTEAYKSAIKEEDKMFAKVLHDMIRKQNKLPI